MRKAGQHVWSAFKNFYGWEPGQDLIETGVKGAIAASGQAALTDMTPEEIALATVIGMSGAMAARPIGKRVGRRVGRGLDERGFDNGGMQKMSEFLQKGMKHENRAVREGSDLLNRRFMNNYGNKDGSIAGYWEGVLGEIARESSDDLTQVGLAVALPQLFDRMPSEEEQLAAGTQRL